MDSERICLLSAKVRLRKVLALNLLRNIPMSSFISLVLRARTLTIRMPIPSSVNMFIMDGTSHSLSLRLTNLAESLLDARKFRRLLIGAFGQPHERKRFRDRLLSICFFCFRRQDRFDILFHRQPRKEPRLLENDRDFFGSDP